MPFLEMSLLHGYTKAQASIQSSLWSKTYGRPLFTATMSRKRFREILSIHMLICLRHGFIYENRQILYLAICIRKFDYLLAKQ